MSVPSRIAECGPCQRDTKRKLSSFWCVECNEGLCLACKKAHSLLKTTGDHHLIENERSRPDSISLADVTDLQKCKFHEQCIIEQFCNNHSTPCCSRCVEETHISCKDIEPLSAAAKSTDISKACVNTISRFDKLLKSLCVVKQGKVVNIADFKHSDQEVKNKIETMRNDLLVKIKGLTETLIQTSHELRESNLSTLNGDLKSVVVKIEDLEHKKKQLQLFSQNGTDEHTFLLLRKLKLELAAYEAYIRQEIETSENKIIHFEPNTSIMSCLNLESLGHVCIKTEPSDLSLKLSEKEMEKDELDDTDSLEGVLTLQKTSEFEIDVEGFISGMCATDDDLIVLCVRGTNKLLLFTLSGKPKGEITVSGNPFNVTRVHGTEKVVVVLPDTSQLQLVDTDLQKAENVINLPEKCWSVTVIKNKLLIAGGEKCLHVLNVKGEKLDEILKPEHGRTYSLSFTGDKFVYCSDKYCKNGTVYCITDEGKPVIQYENSNLKTPTEVTTDKNGNIYICDLDSNNVQRYTETGDLIDVPVKGDDVVEPRSVCFTKNKSHLAISNNNGKTVFVYECIFDQTGNK